MGEKKTWGELDTFLMIIGKQFGPCEILLFGSCAEGSDWGKSDYDLIIISEKFAGMHWLDRISAVVKNWNLIEDIDVIPYTPEEFELKKKNSSFIRGIVRKSVSLASN